MRQLLRVTMSMRELDRLKCVQAVIDGAMQIGVAAERLGLSSRQLRRVLERYRGEGPVGLISRRYRRPSNNRLEAALETRSGAWQCSHIECTKSTIAIIVHSSMPQ
jgi:hypothetical protein